MQGIGAVDIGGVGFNRAPELDEAARDLAGGACCLLIFLRWPIRKAGEVAGSRPDSLQIEIGEPAGINLAGLRVNRDLAPNATRNAHPMLRFRNR